MGWGAWAGGGKEVPGFVVQDIVSAGDLFTTVVTIPNERCALVIGRQERTLKSLQEQSGTHMAIMPQKGLLPHRRLSVRSASTVCVEFATLLIRDIVEGMSLLHLNRWCCVCSDYRACHCLI